MENVTLNPVAGIEKGDCPQERVGLPVPIPEVRFNAEHGPFDLIGDIHGCHQELVNLLSKLGYEIALGETPSAHHPQGRKAIFLGDLVGRGPKIPEVLKLVLAMVESKNALCVPGNHDIKLLRKLQGRPVEVNRGLAESLSQLAAQPEGFRQKVINFFDTLAVHLVLDDSKLVAAHAGMKEEMQGKVGQKIREFALFGEKTGEIDQFGFAVRYNWAAEYHGSALVVYGHTPIPGPEWVNNTINIDTGCIFGGRLTALRYPEKELLSVPALHIYWPGKPFLHSASKRELASY
jgi:protein phosphatase